MTNPFMWSKLLSIAVGGAAGAVARYALHQSTLRWSFWGLPTGTLLVNLIGCFLFGFIWALMGHRLPMGSLWRTGLFVGFLGSFTTFSTLAFETYHLAEDAMPIMAVLNIALHGVLGLLLVWGGISLGRSL